MLPFLSDKEYAKVTTAYNLPDGCPTCSDRGEYILYGEVYQCDCRDQRQLAKAYYNANIGKLWHPTQWEDFQSVDKENLLPKMQAYVEHFARYARAGVGWTIEGGLGTGKTLLMTLVLKDVIKQGRNCYFVEGNELIDIFTSSWRDDEAKVTLDRRLRQVELLGIDELITGRSDAQTDLIALALESVIRHRYNNALPTLLTTNLSTKTQEKDFPRVFSLLASVNDRYRTSGIDWRVRSRDRDRDIELNDEVRPVD